MELLSFDSTSPDEHYGKWISECRAALPELPVISNDLATTNISGVGFATRSSLGGRLPDFGRELEASRLTA